MRPALELSLTPAFSFTAPRCKPADPSYTHHAISTASISVFHLDLAVPRCAKALSPPPPLQQIDLIPDDQDQNQDDPASSPLPLPTPAKRTKKSENPIEHGNKQTLMSCSCTIIPCLSNMIPSPTNGSQTSTPPPALMYAIDQPGPLCPANRSPRAWP